jgi:hypothetical protein
MGEGEVTHEDDPGFNALAIATATNLDWEYLLQRGRHSPRRVLSLLVYADSCDVPIPADVLAAMWDEAYPRTAGERRAS